jgi:hypothetical protein
MSRDVTITVESAGVTEFAVGHTSDGRRVIVAQPEVGDRLAPGNRIVVEERFARAPRITEWRWEDPRRRRVVELERREAARAEAARVDAYRGLLEKALSIAEVPASGEPWEARLDDLLAAIPERDPSLPFGTARQQEERLRLALEAWLAWAKDAPIDQAAFDGKLAARLPHGVLWQLGLRGFVPAPATAEEALRRLEAAPCQLPPRLLACARRIVEDRAFRDAWQWMTLELEGRWAEEADHAMELPPRRYYAIARGIDLYAVDVREPERGIWCVGRSSGEAAPWVGAESFDALLAEVLEDAEDVVSVEPDESDREAIATLTRWVHG